MAGLVPAIHVFACQSRDARLRARAITRASSAFSVTTSKRQKRCLNLGEALGLAAAKPVCLLCLERDPQQCHRLSVADRMAKEGDQPIRHLFADVAGDLI